MKFYFPYQGNKRNEVNEILPLINVDKYSCFVEPFGGSCAISRTLYKLTKKEYVISDNDSDLVYFCNNFYKNDDKIIKCALKKLSNINNKDEYLKYIKSVPKKHSIKWMVHYLIFKTYYQLRPGLYPSTKSKPSYKLLMKNKDDLNDFFRNNEYKYSDFKEVLDKYKNNEQCLVILDPPYLFSSFNFYNCNTNNHWEGINEFINSCKCDFIMIVDDNLFMKLAFNKWFYGNYGKIYENRKRSVKHNIFTNIKMKNNE